MEAPRSRLIKGAFLLALLLIILVIVSIFSERTPKNGLTEQEERQQREIAAGYEAPTSITSISGTVLSVIGATIQLDAADPRDYLPHTDGTSRKRMTRFVTVTKQTVVHRVNERKFDASGNLVSSPIQLSVIKSGDTVTVIADHNILNESEFDAVEVRLVVQ